MSDGGKGDRRRPAAISQEELKERWEAIFPPKGKKEKETTGVGSIGETKKDENTFAGHRNSTKSCACMGAVESKCRN